MTIDTKTMKELQVALEEKKAEIIGELEKFATKDENGEYQANFPEDLGTERSENANEVEEYTDRLAVEKTLESSLTDINDALARMEAGTYGIDANTGEPIDTNRLKAYPAARTNITK